MPRHIPSIIIVLEGYSPPCASIEPIWEQHIHTLATMNIPAIPDQAVTFQLVADLQDFSRHRLRLCVVVAFAKPPLFLTPDHLPSLCRLRHE